MSVSRTSTSRIAAKQPMATNKNNWVRPADWLPMPEVLPDGKKIVILNAVHDTESEFVALQLFCTGGYTVDWGDGTIENYASNAIAEKTYNYSTISDSTICTRGYKQVLITITPTVSTEVLGSGIASPVQLTKKHTNIIATSSGASNYLDIIASIGPNSVMTGLGISGNTPCPILERFIMLTGKFVIQQGFNNCRSIEVISNLDCNQAPYLYAAFAGCNKLEYIPELTNLALNAVSPTLMMNSTFLNCTNLKEVNAFSTNSTGAGSWNQCFSGCTSLTKIGAFNISASDVSSCFNNCYNLKTIDATFNLSACTNISSCFFNCTSLDKIPSTFLSSITATLTQCASAFAGCVSLESVEPFVTTNCTSMSGLFNGCANLSVAPMLDTAKATNWTSFMTNCSKLRYIPTYSLAAMSSANGAFAPMISLRELPAMTIPAALASYTGLFPTAGNLAKNKMLGLSQSFSMANNQMSATELNNMYTNLATVTAKTVTVTGNWGTATDNPTIATAKGWTVTG